MINFPPTQRTEVGMTETEFREYLDEALVQYSDENGGEVANTGSFNDRGVLTSNEGLVVRMEDGTEFQVTIVRSR